MSLPPRLLEKYLQRIDDLIKQGNSMLKNIKTEYTGSYFANGRPEVREYVDFADMNRWKTSCVSVLGSVIPENSLHWDWVKAFNSLRNKADNARYAVAKLKAVREDLSGGFLDDLALRIEAEMAADYMQQAEYLVSEGASASYGHVPAAVLAAAVLEKELRYLCSHQNPVIPTVSNNGKPKTLEPLINDLTSVGVFNQARAKQLKAWAAIRNHAAHGEFDQFSRADVETMLKGITSFIADCLD